MRNLIVWALLTGIIAGGVWLGIVVFDIRHRLRSRRPDLVDADALRQSEELERMSQRLAEIEERLDFAERLLTGRREEKQLSPPAAQ